MTSWLPRECHSVDRITREHVEAFIGDQLARLKPTSAAVRYRSLQQFFKWCVVEGEIAKPADNPMARMKPPKVPEAPPPIISEDAQRKLLKVCEGAAFEDRHNNALIRVLIDTGMRRSECAGLKLEDVDFDHNVLYVVGKGGRPRACAFGHRTARALDRYVRVRGQHRDSALPALWIGRAGAVTPSAVAIKLWFSLSWTWLPTIRPGCLSGLHDPRRRCGHMRTA
jgi:site-specific recombinase XerD